MLAERFGTPVYVISEDQIRRNLRRLRDAFAASWPGAVAVLPSIKANASLAVRRILTEEDTGCDAFGPAELEAALRCGVAPERISLNGPTKSETLIASAVRLGVRITLDSVHELELAYACAERIGRAARVRLRLRPDYTTLAGPSQLIPGEGSIRAAASAYKAGIPTADVLALRPADLARQGVEVRGLHVHLGRHDAAPATWRGMAEAYVATIARVLERHPGLPIAELDIGGGLPAPRDPFGRAAEPAPADPFAPRAAPLTEYAEAIAPVLADGLRRLGRDPASVTLELEPGRALFADAGVHLTTVRGIKREADPYPRTWIETDTSDAWLPDVVLEGNRWTAVAAGRADAPRTERADVVGTTCAPDIIISAESLPEVAPGDVLAVLDTGAYQEAAASNFNSLPRPGTVLVHGAQAELIRRPETVADVFARDIMPERLATDAALPRPWRAHGLDHVSVTVGDLARSTGFYCGLLGLAVREQGEASDTEIGEIAGVPGARVRWTDLVLDDGSVLELLQYLTPSGDTVRFDAHCPGASHISLRVGDIAAAHGRLTAAGRTPLSAPTPVTGSVHWDGAVCFYVRDPDGVIVELIEWASPGGSRRR